MNVRPVHHWTFTLPVLSWLMVIVGFSVACAPASDSDTATSAADAIVGAFGELEVTQLFYQGRGELDPSKPHVCGPFAEFTESYREGGYFTTALDNPRQEPNRPADLVLEFNDFWLRFNNDTGVKLEPIGTHEACQLLGKSPCVRDSQAEVQDTSNFDGAIVAHGFRTYLTQSPQLSELLGQPASKVLHFQQAQIVRQYFENGALEYNLNTGTRRLSDLGRELRQRQGQTELSPIPGICLADSSGVSQPAIEMNPAAPEDANLWQRWLAQAGIATGGIIALGFVSEGTGGVAGLGALGFCATGPVRFVLCALSAVVVAVLIAGAVILLQISVDRSRYAETSNNDQTQLGLALLQSMFLGETTLPVAAYGPLPDSLWATAEFGQAGITIANASYITVNEPLPPHYRPNWQGLDDEQLRDAAIGAVLDDLAETGGQDMNDLVAELERLQHEFEESLGQLDELPVWLDNLENLSAEELAEFLADWGLTEDQLNAWTQQARVWHTEEERQIEAVLDVIPSMLKDAKFVATTQNKVSAGQDVEAQVDTIAEKLVQSYQKRGLTRNQALREIAESEREIDEVIRTSKSTSAGEQYEEVMRRALGQAREAVRRWPR